MAITVTDQMVAEAWRVLPGVAFEPRIRRALEAALAVAPSIEQVLDIPVTALVHLEVDQQQLTAAVQDAAARLREQIGAAPDGRLRLATLDEPVILDSGLEGPGVRDASGSGGITVNCPTPHEALAAPLVLGGVSEVVSRLRVARSTVVGWTKNTATNGMPEPLAQLAAGPVWDLEAVATWHAQWKGTA